MNKPELSKPDAQALIKQSGKVILEPVMILSIRGFFKDSMSKTGTNSRGIYDDAMFLIGPDLFLPVNANTDPSVFRKGIPSLIPGLHYYKKGMHQMPDAEPYAAFRPDTSDESLPVTRDGEIGISKEIAVNIHQGGYTSTSSEGCQTIYPNEWLEFQQAAYQAMDNANQKWIGYLLIEK